MTKMKTNRLYEFVNKTKIDWLVIIPILLSLLMISGGGYLVQQFFQGNFADRLLASVTGIAAFVAGLSGLAQIIKKEAPRTMIGFTNKGIWPVISGFAWLLFTWIISVTLFYIAIFGD